MHRGFALRVYIVSFFRRASLHPSLRWKHGRLGRALDNKAALVPLLATCPVLVAVHCRWVCQTPKERAAHNRSGPPLFFLYRFPRAPLSAAALLLPRGVKQLQKCHATDWCGAPALCVRGRKEPWGTHGARRANSVAKTILRRSALSLPPNGRRLAHDPVGGVGAH